MTESFRGKLRRLRRDPAGDASNDAPSTGANTDVDAGARRAPDWMRERLGKAARKRRVHAKPAPQDEAGLWPRSTTDLGCIEVRGQGDAAFAARTTWFDQSWMHGTWRLEEVDGVRPSDFHTTTNDAGLADLDLRRAVYLDTETTGLSGGAGTSVFMIGLGRFVGERFELWQGFLRSPAEERALLAECAFRIARSSGVVSFFGKSFDRHRLEDKMRIHGVPAPFDDVPHLDLCHPLRRLYRAALPDARLRTMEAALVGVDRDDDLPGAHAPEAWFDYLAGRPHRVEGVFQHNLDDVLSLATLAAHLGRTTEESRTCGATLPGDPAARAAGMAKSMLAMRDRIAALLWLDRAIERTSDAQAQRTLHLARAETLRLAKRPAEALTAYKSLASAPEDRHSVAALLGLAKLLEHHTRDRAGALELCHTAEAILERQLLGGAYARTKRELAQRVERLSRGSELDGA